MRSCDGTLLTPAVATIVSVIAGFGAAVAQEPNIQGAMSPGMMGRGAMMCRMDEYVHGQLAYLKTVLKITETQTPQWNVFADAFRADREKSAGLCKEAMEQARAVKSAGLIDSLTLVETQLEERLESLLCEFEQGSEKDRRSSHEAWSELLMAGWQGRELCSRR